MRSKVSSWSCTKTAVYTRRIKRYVIKRVNQLINVDEMKFFFRVYVKAATGSRCGELEKIGKK